eukprot:3011797-Pleurochrysis_carterae.AAC.3
MRFGSTSSLFSSLLRVIESTCASRARDFKLAVTPRATLHAMACLVSANRTGVARAQGFDAQGGDGEEVRHAGRSIVSSEMTGSCSVFSQSDGSVKSRANVQRLGRAALASVAHTT